MDLDLDLIAAGTQSRRSNVGMFLPHLKELVDEFDITTPLRLARFFAQVAHESMHFQKTEEDLHYKAATLLRLFPWSERRQWGFTSLSDAANYEMQPEKIANRIYANRMGNGDEASGEGWLHRGRGLIQLTGAENYAQYWVEGSGELGPVAPDLLSEPYHASRSACWYWKRKGCNILADADSVALVTERVNGGRIGLAERQDLTRSMKTALGIE